MRSLKCILLLGILALCLFGSTCSACTHGCSMAWRKRNVTRFDWDVYLWFPDGPPTPYYMDANLWWVDYSVGSEDLYIREFVICNLYFFCRGVRDTVDGPDDQDGTYVLEMVVVWRLEEGEDEPIPYPGRTSLAGWIKFHCGTGIFEDMKGFGRAEVTWYFHPYEGVEHKPPENYMGPIMVQQQTGVIRNSP